MSARSCLLAGGMAIWWTATGCNESAQRWNAPPQGPNVRAHAMQSDMSYMVDNAMLHDMSVADMHFVPHTDKLNGTGARRLNRYAALLATYGGTLHYETYETDEALVEGRVNTIKAALAQAGLDMEQISVEPGLSRGRGARATDAIERMLPADTTPTRRIININKTE